MSRPTTWDAADRLALQTARAVLDPRDAEAPLPVPDPEALPAMLASHSLLMHANPAWPLYSLSAAQQERMAKHIKLLGIIALTRTRHVAEVADALDAAGIRFMLVKGVALAQQAWGSTSVRGAGDIDVLVAERDLERTAAVLQELGAVPQRTDRDLRPRPLDRRMHHALTFHYADTDVDVHYRLDNIPTVFTASFDELFARRAEVEIGSRAIPTLSPLDALFLAACHGGRDAWAKWGSVLDFVVLLRRVGRPLDELANLAQAIGADARLGVALALGRVLDPTLPEQDRRATRVARGVVRLHAEGSSEDVWVLRRQGWAQYRVMLDSAGTREAYLWGVRNYVWEGDLDERPDYQGMGAPVIEVASKVRSMAAHAVGLRRSTS